MSFDLSELEKRSKDTLKDVGDGARSLVSNTLSDLQVIYGSISDCAAALDTVGERVRERAIEYYTTITRTLIDNALIPADLIDEVFQKVAPDLLRDPNPRLFHLTNPKEAVWGGQAPNLIEVLDGSVFPNEPFDQNLFFVHGMDYRASENEVYEDMFLRFERNVRFFNSGRSEPKGVFLMSYDSKLTDEADTIIRRGFESVLATPVTGNAPMMILAVFWHELERRARIAGDHLLSLISGVEQGDNKHYLFSHSLGCFVVAHMAHKFYTNNPQAGPLFSGWHCMAAAVPANAFKQTGIFSNAARLTKQSEGWLEVLFSNLDDVLSTAYITATSVPAMGQFGGGAFQLPLNNGDLFGRNRDMTEITGFTHKATGGYFELVAPTIRDFFGLRDQLNARSNNGAEYV